MVALAAAVAAAATIPCVSAQRVLVNVAQGKPTLSDSEGVYTYWHGADVNGGTFRSSYAVDGLLDNAHRWASDDSHPRHWLMIDLQARYSISAITMFAGFDDDEDGSIASGQIGTDPTDGVCGYVIEAYTGYEAGHSLSTLSSRRDPRSWSAAASTTHTITREHTLNVTQSSASSARFLNFSFDQSGCPTGNIVRIFEVEVLAEQQAESQATLCAMATMEQLLLQVTNRCCDGTDCNSVPDVCSSNCATAFTALWDHCGPSLSSGGQSGSTLHKFYQLCQTVEDQATAAEVALSGCTAVANTKLPAIQQICALNTNGAVPTRCTRECSDAFMPFYSSCRDAGTFSRALVTHAPYIYMQSLQLDVRSMQQH